MQTALFVEDLGIQWLAVSSSDPRGMALFRRHYSHSNVKRATSACYGNLARFAGPGESMVLLTPAIDALFVWRLERFRQDGQTGVNCAVFRNEGGGLSSDLIREADRLADLRWPQEGRHFTFVDPEKVRGTNPGYCFLKAGWRRCGQSARGLLIFERFESEVMPNASDHRNHS